LVGGRSSFNQSGMYEETAGGYLTDIPQSELTAGGLAYYIVTVDLIGNTTTSDTSSIPIDFPAGTLTTSMANSAFPDGFPYEKWRLISLPGDIDNKTISATISDELGNQPSDSTWMLYRYVGPGPNNYQVASSFALGKSYFLKRVDSEQALNFNLGAGQSYDLTDFSITLLSRKWHFVSAPYPFPVTVAANQTTFIGPYAYGEYGAGGQEGWSLNQVQYSFKPWGGYIIYNNTDQLQTLEIKPPGLAKGLLAKTGTEADSACPEPCRRGWLLHLTASGERYFDAGNVIGRVGGALDGLDDWDHPEPPTTDGYISVTMDRPDWAGQRTSDIRSVETTDGVWDLALDTKGETGPITLTHRLEGEPPPAIVLVDLAARKVYRLSDGEVPGPVTDYHENFAYRLKLVAGSASYVSGTTSEILAALPADFALAQNYPNPFNPVTTLEFTLPHPARISLQVYDLLGREVVTLADGWLDMGPQTVVWAGQDRRGAPAATGIYFAVLRSVSATRTIKMLLLK
ncbi:MAG: T9SS type A sorting domain-containing protein, partial [Candidatus Neomarinimicrobiota bacterium]